MPELFREDPAVPGSHSGVLCHPWISAFLVTQTIPRGKGQQADGDAGLRLFFPQQWVGISRGWIIPGAQTMPGKHLQLLYFHLHPAGIKHPAWNLPNIHGFCISMDFLLVFFVSFSSSDLQPCWSWRMSSFWHVGKQSTEHSQDDPGMEMLPCDVIPCLKKNTAGHWRIHTRKKNLVVLLKNYQEKAQRGEVLLLKI